ncbi:hypothetical protein COOONC_23396 [Cooperia oncophora]
MLAEDFDLYLSGGQSTMFFICHLMAIIPPVILYTWTITILVKRRRLMTASKTLTRTLNSRVESRLLLPCIINMAVFIVGQVVITIGTGEGKWAGFTVMLVFCSNSALNPILLLVCSKSIRRHVQKAVGYKNLGFTSEMFTSTIYQYATNFNLKNPLAVRSKTNILIPSPAMSAQIQICLSPTSSESSTHV